MCVNVCQCVSLCVKTRFQSIALCYLSSIADRYLVLDTKQRSLSLSQEGMALLFQLLVEQPGVVVRCVEQQRPAATRRCLVLL